MNTKTHPEPADAVKSGGLDIHQTVTNTIIAQLEKGTPPWQKPWNAGLVSPYTMPKNVTTGNKYRGINIPLLWISAAAQDFTTQEWASFNQWKAQKEHIARGQKGTMIIYYDTFEREQDGEIKKIPFVKTSYVFNRCQLTSYTPDAQPQPEPAPLVERIAKVDTFIANTKAIVKHGGNRAFYAPAIDSITMPFQERFIDTATRTATEGYYSVLLHELTHWTGHKSRCDRLGNSRFGSKPYAFEELIAELGSAFLCAELEITNAPKSDHASYIASWLQVLKDDKKAILTAASEATKICDFLQRFQLNGTDTTQTPAAVIQTPDLVPQL
ncbi:ArdC family protein [Taibaiella koreensis]|uniref:ArdC family protein n=1 Tax=Taibaiella koreensis TaxID=1268548 RepID=UPI000E59BB35|nr:zincin-like metallopeptidase domain-containing protein [Taibaiella koreensis]